MQCVNKVELASQLPMYFTVIEQLLGFPLRNIQVTVLLRSLRSFVANML